MSYEDLYREYDKRRDTALAMGGREKLERRRNAGLLNARERINYLFDKGSFLESGMFAASAKPEDRDTTPGDGKLCGYGRIDGREAVQFLIKVKECIEDPARMLLEI